MNSTDTPEYNKLTTDEHSKRQQNYKDKNILSLFNDYARWFGGSTVAAIAYHRYKSDKNEEVVINCGANPAEKAIKTEKDKFRAAKCREDYIVAQLENAHSSLMKSMQGEMDSVVNECKDRSFQEGYKKGCLDTENENKKTKCSKFWLNVLASLIATVIWMVITFIIVGAERREISSLSSSVDSLKVMVESLSINNDQSMQNEVSNSSASNNVNNFYLEK